MLKHSETISFDSIKSHYSSSSIIYSDLSHVLMCPFQLALDIAAHFNDDSVQQIFDKIKQPIVKKHAGLAYEYWIDYDSIGNVARIKAQDLVTLLRPILDKACTIIIIQLSTHALAQDNVALIEFINTQVPHIPIHLMGISKQDLPAALAHAQTIESTPDQFDSQTAPSLNAVNLYADTLYAHPKAPIFYREQAVCPDHDIQHIMQYAWMVTHFDALELAKNIFNYAYQHSQVAANQLHYLLCLQVVRVGLQEYSAVMQQPYPAHIDESAFAENLLYSKAYAGVLSRHFDQAGHYFDALDVTEMQQIDSIESLYRLNIFALYLFHRGKRETALQVEKLIEDNLPRFAQQNTMFIEYINALNLSRVYRANNDFPTSKKYCDHAYASIVGLKTDSDHVYQNIYNGMLYEALAEHENALYAWLRAALHWIAMPCQSALAWRPQAALLGRDFKFNQPLDIERFNQIFFDKVTLLAEKNNLSIPKQLKYGMQIKALAPSNIAYVKYIGANGLSFLLTSNPTSTLGPQQLANYISTILQAACNEMIPDQATILIDANRGFGMPMDEYQLRARCYALGLKQYTYQGKKYYLNEEITAKMQLSLSPAVYQFTQTDEQTIVQFKRYHEDIVLNQLQAKLISLLQAQHTMSLHTATELMDSAEIKKLYDHNVICLHVA